MPRPKGGSGNVSPRQSTGSVNTHRVGSASKTPTPSSSTRSQPNRTQPTPTPTRMTNDNRGGFPWTGIFLGSMLANMSRRNTRQTYNQYPPNYPPNQYPPTGYPSNQYPPNQYPPQYQQQRRSSGAATIVVIVFFIFMLLMMMSLFGCSSGPTNDYNREKFNNPIAYNADCIVDELGFFVNPEETGERLKTFYNMTGVQPYIVISENVPGVNTDAQLEQYAQKYYEANIDNQNTFLYMYMGDADYTEDDAVGEMVVYRGNNIKSVMDDAAVNIFWDYMDQEWRSDLETDDLFVKVYDQTAKRIMTKSTTSKDIWLWVVIIAGIVLLCLLGLYYVKLKHKREREKAAETKAILETPLATDDPNDDDLLKRYGG